MTEDVQRKKILVVDDDPGAVALISKALEEKGFLVLKGSNGKEALDIIKQHLPDLIIIDRMMPKMDGIKACAFLKADKRFYKIPVIMITASAEKSDQELSKEVGVEVFLNKPLDINDLESKVKTLIGWA